DVGTNSEIVLGSSARALATAAPAGPAFEAAQIKCGMRAADGAIEGVKIVGDEVELTVIGDVEPVGICGSGLVDAVSELVGAGLLDHSGKFVAGEGAKIAALSVQERAAAQAVLDEVAYVELSGRSDFNDLFIDQLAFPG